MKKLFGWLLNPWLLAALGLAALALVIWFIGPMVAIGDWRPLTSETARWVLIVAIIAIYAAHKLWGAWRARQANSRVVADLAAQAAPSIATESAEARVLRERFEAALKTLRNVRFGASGGLWTSLSWKFGRQYLYQLPWYVIVGAPGAGKTTALLNSGLQFPLADRLGRGAIKGVGGTRNCDWWFTDRAVLLDTAGRYTTHESDPEADRQAWQSFLGLLKKARPRRPVNGVLLAVSVTDLLAFSAEQRAAHAAALRSRIKELHETLGIRMPVYVLLTKCDLLAGFMDYFADLDKAERAQVWGTTFDYEAAANGKAVEAFSAEFDLLTKRLLDGVIERVQAEPDPQRRARIYAFPQQFGGLRDALDDLLRLAFAPSAFEQAPLLRGVYFISGTQEGTPIDRLLGAIARELHLERLILPPNQNSGRSFFLTRLLTEVVFPEAELVGANLKWETRRRWIAAGCYAAIGAVTVGLLAVWIGSYANNRGTLARAGSAAAAAKKIVDATPLQVSADPLPLLPALNAARALAPALDPDDVPWSHGFGLYQGRRLGAAAAQAYEQVLADLLPPRLLARVEQQLRTRGDNLDALYEALKVYLMLTTPERFDREAVRQVVLDDWRGGLLSAVNAEERAQLEAHLDALLASGGRSAIVKADAQLVQRVRDQLRNVPLTQRIYTRLKLQGVGNEFPEFTVRKHAGELALAVFVRAGGEPLTRGVPGLYTKDGYEKGFKRAVDAVTAQLADEESWVLGVTDATSRLKDPLQVQRLIDDVRRLYLNDYIRIWEAFVADIKLARVTGLRETINQARILSAPDNPLAPLLRAIVREVTLATPDPTSIIDKTIDTGTSFVRKGAERIFGTDKAGALPGVGEPIELMVDRRFTALRQFVLPPAAGKPAPMEQSVALIAEIYNWLVAAEAATKAGSTPPPADGGKVTAEAARYPEPLRSLLATLSAAGIAVVQGATRGNLTALARADVGEFCQKAIAGRYPFVRNSGTDATREDFAALFAPGGRFDAFFQKNLAPLVDTTTNPWSFRQIGDTKTADVGGLLPPFQRAKVIRDTFFPAGSPQPLLRLQFRPLDMDQSITRFNLTIDGQVVTYAHGPQSATPVQWPGPAGGTQVRIELSPPIPGRNSALTESGPWALFRLLERMRIEPTASPERFRVTFDIEGRRAMYEITTASVVNPFRLREMQDFRCPGV
jgi:type VI secretion system protein ImpL